MRAITIPRFGPSEVLTLVEDLEVPRPRAGEVTIDVAYAGVNYAEIMYRRGSVPATTPMVPGIEAAGRIREVGAGVEHLTPGQPVVAMTMVENGGYAEVVRVDARLVAVIPSEDEDLLITLAGTPSNTTTAVLALESAGHLTAGETVLVHAAAGGLGSQMGQVAAARGPASVIGTVGSAAKIDAARSFGYDTVLLRDEWAADPTAHRANLIVDPVGGPTRVTSIEALTPGGRIVVIGNASNTPDITVGANELFLASRTIAGFSMGALCGAEPALAGAGLRDAVQLVASGKVRVDVNTILPLEQAAEAHRRVESGRTVGKTILRVRP